MSRCRALLALMWIISGSAACSSDADSTAQSNTAGAPATAGAAPTSPAGASGAAGSAGIDVATRTTDPAQGAAGASNAGSAAMISAGTGANAAGMGGTPASDHAAGSAAPPAAGSGALPPPPTPAPLRWSACGSYDCATLEVPLDYAAPNGEQIKLAVKRRAARGNRIGALVVNPGGPGASAVDFLSGFAAGPGASLSQFDLVAFDPRGVGQSTPLDCHSTIERLLATDPSPDDEAEWTAIDQAASAFADECAMKHAKLLPHMGTADVARDMDQLRAALGEEKLTYFGYSYGTELGAWYADLFPQRVRAFVLDGALDMKLSGVEIAFEQAGGFERSLESYFGWCGASANNCRWTQDREPATAYRDLAAAIDAKPIAARTGNRKLGPGEFMIGVIAPLYGGVEGFRSLSTSLVAATGGDASALLANVDAYTERRRDGTYANIQEANNAVNCLDLPTPPYADLRAEASRFANAYPLFGISTLTSLLVCAHWPVHAQKAPPPRAAGAAPILVIGTTGDPATPYAWAEALASYLESAVLLTYEGEGHTAYGRGVRCIDDAVNAYLVKGTVPAKGTRCGSGAAALNVAPNLIRIGPMR